MTPAARIQAAIEILDESLAGTPTEKALTTWARSHRFAGSGDRAAIRDLVFDAIRCRRSFAARGGSLTGRGLMLGALRDAGRDPAAHFTGDRHAPAPLTADEAAFDPPPPDRLTGLDCPDWIAPALEASLGPDFEPVMAALRHRAPVFLRTNTARATVADVIAALDADGIEARPHALAPTAIEVTGHARRLRHTAVYLDGRAEVQDAASQAAIAALPPLRPAPRILDLCAGGGGKALALAARYGASIDAHDANPRRMTDLPVRAARAGADIRLLEASDPETRAPYDLVFCDVPCSGSGAWRRQADAKWTLDAAGLDRLTATQASILDRAAALVAPGGTLAYATCSLLDAENAGQVDAFLARSPGWTRAASRLWTPLDGGDGFGLAILTRD